MFESIFFNLIMVFELEKCYDAILPPRALDKRLQEDWAGAAKEGPRILISLMVDFWPMG